LNLSWSIQILVPLVLAVSKSLFLLLLLVALLTVGVSLQSGAMRFGEDNFTADGELRADLASLKSDANVIVRRLQDAPHAVQNLWEDVRRDFIELKAEAKSEAHDAAHRLASLIKTNS